MNFKEYLATKKALIEEALKSKLPAVEVYPSMIHEALYYSVCMGGKRMRPLWVLAACESVDGDSQQAISAACAVEFIHTYSIIHDDLPALDDDDYRRGNLSCHKRFSEAIAILAGDALLTEAFSAITEDPLLTPEIKISIITEISRAIGTGGMIGGQVMDILSEGKPVDIPTLQYIHSHKTGSLICCSVKVGGLIGKANAEQMITLIQYGEHIGMAFQIVNDIKSYTTTQRDIDRKKMTYPAVYGVKGSIQKVEELIAEAITGIKSLDEDAWKLKGLAQIIREELSVCPL